MNILSGRYRLGDVVYGDAVVAVHRGQDQLLNRTVSIEISRPDHPDETVSAALRDKARRMALAELPHLAALYDQGEDAGQPYLVFEELSGVPLAEAAPLDPSDVATLIASLAATLRAAQKQQIRAPRLDAGSVRFGDGRAQIVDWGVTAPVQSDLAALTPLLALAATGSETGDPNRGAPPPIMRVVQRALAGEYASVDALEQELQQAVSAAEDPTVAVTSARPTVLVSERSARRPPERSAARASSPPRQRRPTLMAGAGILLLLGLLAGGLVLRGRSSSADAPVAAPSGAGVAATELAETSAAPSPTEQGTPYIVATNNGRRLNVREGPGENFRRIGALPNGAEVRMVEGPVDGGRFRWARVEGDGIAGWCVFEALRPR